MEYINYTDITRNDIEEIIKMKPVNVLLYKKAFVHKSVTKFAGQKDVPEYFNESYERFEFLGDSVLNLIVANYLFKEYKDQEGTLTKLRTRLVNGKTLAKFAKKLNFNKFLIISNNVEAINGRNNDRILEDIFESFICSIYLDLGFSYVEKFILDLIKSELENLKIEEDNNYKDILLRFCQNKLSTTPTYKTVEEKGPPHNRIFIVCTVIQNINYEKGTGKSKKNAEQESAKNTLIKFGVI